MHKVVYGSKTIEYVILINDALKSHYITVEKGVGVTLKGKELPIEKADQLILKKARWILDKLELVKSLGDHEIVTGSRVQYLGRKYYVEVIINNDLSKIDIEFNESKFKVRTPDSLNNQTELVNAFEEFYRIKAKEKITLRVKKLSKKTGLDYADLKIRKLEKRWGSCTPSNTIVLNIDTVRLPFSLIDYLIIHELVHTKVRSHSKEFWAELSKHIPNWKELDEKMYGMKL